MIRWFLRRGWRLFNGGEELAAASDGEENLAVRLSRRVQHQRRLFIKTAELILNPHELAVKQSFEEFLSFHGTREQTESCGYSTNHFNQFVSERFC